MADNNDDSSQNPTTVVGLLINFAIHFAVACACLLSVSLLRSKNSLVYAKKEKYYGEEEAFKKPPTLKPGLFKWLKDVASVDDMKLLPYIGPDALVALRFMKNALSMFSWLSLVGVCVLIPLYIIAGPISDNSAWHQELNMYSGADKAQLRLLTVQNIPRGSGFIAAPLVGIYIVSAIVLYYIYRMAYESTSIRKAYLQSPEYLESLHARTLLLINLPESACTEKGIESLVDTMQLPQKPLAVHMGHELKTLPEETIEYNKLVIKFEGVISKYLLQREKAKKAGKKPVDVPMVRVENKIPFIGGRKVNAFDYYPSQLHEGEDGVYGLRVKSNSFRSNAFAFLSFSSINAANEALIAMRHNKSISQSMLLSKKAAVYGSPDSNDLLHEHCELSKPTVLRRNVVSVVCTIILVLIWAAFSAMVVALVKLNTLQPYAPALANWLQANKVPNFLFTTFAPPIVLILLQMLLAFLLRAVVHYKAFISQSKEDRNLMRWLFIFSVWNTVVISAVGVLIPNINVIFDRSSYNAPDNGLSFTDNMLVQGATSFVNSSYFFMNLIVTQYSGYYIAWVQIGPLLVTFIKRRFLSMSWRNHLELVKPIPYKYELVLSSLMLSVFVGLLYSVISPLIMVFCMLTFGVVWLSSKHQLLYIAETANETGGKWFWRIYECLTFSLLASQLMLLAYVRVFSGVANIELVVLGPIIATIVFLLFIWKRFKKTYSVLLLAGSQTTGSKPIGTLENLSSKTLNEWTSPQMTSDDPFSGKGQVDSANTIDDAFVNPLLIKPLERVIVWPWMQTQLDAIYMPKYSSFSEYLAVHSGMMSPTSSAALKYVKRSVTVVDRKRMEDNRRIDRLLLRHEQQHKRDEIRGAQGKDTKEQQQELNEIEKIIAEYQSPDIYSGSDSQSMYLDSLKSTPPVIHSDTAEEPLVYIGRSKSKLSLKLLGRHHSRGQTGGADTVNGTTACPTPAIFESDGPMGLEQFIASPEANNSSSDTLNAPPHVSNMPRPSNTSSLTNFLENNPQNASEYAAYLRYVDSEPVSSSPLSYSGLGDSRSPRIGARASSYNYQQRAGSDIDNRPRPNEYRGSNLNKDS